VITIIIIIKNTHIYSEMSPDYQTSNSLDVMTTKVMKEKFNRLHFHFGPSPNRHLKTKQMIYKFNMRLSK